MAITCFARSLAVALVAGFLISCSEEPATKTPVVRPVKALCHYVAERMHNAASRLEAAGGRHGGTAPAGNISTA